MAEKTNLSPAKNQQAMKEKILKSVTKRAELINPKLEQISKKWDADMSRIIDETMNFYSGLNINLSADQLAEQIVNTRLKGLNQDKKGQDSNLQPQEKNNLNNGNEKKEAPKYITPNGNNNKKKDPYREETGNDENKGGGGISTQKENKEENRNNTQQTFDEEQKQNSSFGTINQPPKLDDSVQGPNGESFDTEESPQSKGDREQKPNNSFSEANQPPKLNDTVQGKNGESYDTAETPNTKNSNLPPKLKGEEGKPTGDQKNESGDTNGEPPVNTQKNSLGQNLKNIQKVLSQNKTPKKLNVTTWILLGAGAVIIDFVQDALGVTVIALAVNMLADVLIGLILFSFFWFNKMMNRKLAISLALGFLVDFVSLGIMPAWSFDIAYAWLITDGSKVISKIPGAGEKANEAIQKIASKKA